MLNIITVNTFTRNIPNAITCLNVLAGSIAIVFALRCGHTGTLPDWQWAALFIGVAAVADFLDGFMARLLHAYSALGKELDSLCDLVSFGVAPAMLMLGVLPQEGAMAYLRYAALLVPVSGALRLARFNIDTRQSTSFIGLPIPANAIFWIGYAALVTDGTAFAVNPVVWVPLLLVECWLMLSPLPIFSLKFHSWGVKENLARYLLILGAVLIVVIMGLSGLAWLIVYYLLLSLFFK